ncbi:MAG TPA: saccharopine dehydrogenase NADP-binding domain-containing protein [Solirubrobacteraceae bacterium]|nr:saccharopine dehydrogenase NADP-binding domain-containing protein [Solirubrobacteraceae bacterium]
MTARIVLFGATGFTGELTARAFVARGARPLLVGRDRARVLELATRLGTDGAVADAMTPNAVAALAALLHRGDVLVSTVGPFVRWGEPAVRAAIEAGAHYLDSTGEPPFIRSVFEHHGAGAAAVGCGLLTAMGYDYVPGNLAGALALREAGARAVRVDVGYFVAGDPSGQFSGGSRASAAGMLAEPAYAFRNGRVVTERGARHVRRIDGRPVISIGASEQYALPRLHPELREIGVWLGWFGPASRALQVLSGATALATKVPGVARALTSTAERFVAGSTGGPDAATRAKARSQVVAIASDGAGAQLATVRLEGASPYDFTAGMLAWSAIRVARDGVGGSGALGPVEAFGLDELERGVADAGIARSA